MCIPMFVEVTSKLVYVALNIYQYHLHVYEIESFLFYTTQ